MSISIGFTTESKKENSTKQRTMSTTHNCLLKNGCSLLYPTLLLELDTDTFPTYTGFKIENRYYSTTDIKSVRQNLFEISGKVDVLASYKSEILASSQLVSRQQNTYSPLLADKLYPSYNKIDTEQISLNLTPALSSDGVYVVGIINPDAKNGVSYYTLGETSFRQLMSFLFSDVWLPSQTAAEITQDLQKELINPFQYIVSCTWYPFSQFAGDLANIKFGFWDTADYSGGPIRAGLLSESQRIYSFECTGNMPRHPQASTHGINMNGSPYTRYSLECWCFGSIAIDPLPFVQNNAFACEIDVDVFTGSAILYLNDANGVRQIKESASFGCPIQISQAVTDPIKNGAGIAGAGLGAIAATGLFGIAAPVALSTQIAGVAGMGAGIMTALEACFPQVQSKGSIGSKISFMWTPRIQASYFKLPDLAPDRVGRPLMSEVTLSSLSGYTVCVNPAIDLSATDPEEQEVINYMSNGFYIE